MKRKQIIISIGTVLLSTFAVIFIYQRIQRAKADANVVSEDEALKILNKKKSSVTEPDFSQEDLIPQLPND
jgi:hypothetical protein